MSVGPVITNGTTPHGAKSDLEEPQKHPTDPPALNVHEVVLGSLIINPWFSSEGYPEELVGKQANRLYVCQWCFKYTKELLPFLQHLVSAHAAYPEAMVVADGKRAESMSLSI